MQLLATARLASPPLASLQGLPHVGSLHRRHYEHAKMSSLAGHAGELDFHFKYVCSLTLLFILSMKKFRIATNPRLLIA